MALTTGFWLRAVAVFLPLRSNNFRTGATLPESACFSFSTKHMVWDKQWVKDALLLESNTYGTAVCTRGYLPSESNAAAQLSKADSSRTSVL